MRTAAMKMLSAAAILVIASTSTVLAEDWPPAQMTIVISHSVGSSQNQTTRVLGDIWAEKLGTQFVYDNRSGSSGRIGYDHFLRQAADGSVLLSSNLGSASIMYAQQEPDWDWEESLLPLGIFAVDPGAIFVNRDRGWETLEDVLEAAKEQPLTLGVSFWASPENLQVHQMMELTGAQFEVIPIESSGELVTQILGGHIDVGYNKVAQALRGGESLKVVAVPMATNPVPHLTENAPTADAVIGQDTLGIASYRSILAHKEWADANPEHLETLQRTFAETLEDPRFIEEMERLEVDRGLITNLSTEEIYNQVIYRYWSALERFGDIYNQ